MFQVGDPEAGKHPVSLRTNREASGSQQKEGRGENWTRLGRYWE